ncbi:MAG: zinc-dependent alcohol dehydrogenase family protein [Saprospiraceae bacterium]|nr:zinc-dependent alcohol dehydrogenase family protein [Saprospiraceae bacterium]
MQAAYFEAFQSPINIKKLPDPTPPDDGVVIEVKATGICRSDWHGWMGHDSDVSLPHVPGHELAGVIIALGKDVKKWQVGDRVTVPFCGGCGYCDQCATGNQQICDHYFQPGFTAWGSFAEYVAIRYADVNLVKLPDELDFISAALLGCRFITSYRAIIAQGKTLPGQWVAVHGCGGVGLSAVMIANAMGAQVIAVDISDEKLVFAKSIGAQVILNAKNISNIPEAIKNITNGGAHVSVDALGSTDTCINSILSLRKRGKHIQVGLMTAQHARPPIPMGPVIANELEILGSHGMQAHQYPGMLDLIVKGILPVKQLLGKTVTLQEAPQELMEMNNFQGVGVTIIKLGDT